MNTEQFPPSSPILRHLEVDEEGDGDELMTHKTLPKKHVVITTPVRSRSTQLQMPTPNPSSELPSSSIGEFTHEENADVSTSPMQPELLPQIGNTSTSNERAVNDAKYRFISPMDKVKKIHLSNDGKEVVIGRSSKVSDVTIKKRNISKRHAIIKLSTTGAAGQTQQFIEIKCVGRNGLNLTVLRPSVVKFLGAKNEYLIEPADANTIHNLNAAGLSKISRCNHKYDNLTNLIVLNNECVKIPKMKGVLLDIWDEFFVLDYDGDEEASNKEETEIVVDKVNRDVATDMTMIYTPGADAPSVMRDVTVRHEEEGEEVKKSEPKRARSKSAEPEFGSAKRSKKHQQTQEPDQELYKDITEEETEERLSKIDDLEDIENVLINHLAFSRLSSTPLSILHKISHKTSALTKADLQLVLIKKIDCVGVIYRVGKDAAGKSLEEEYYYQVDLDDDKNRQMLVNDLKGASSSLRSCRKVHKQYFWKKPKSKSTK